MQIDRIDHFVLTVRDIDATCDFYAIALGMERIDFGAGNLWASLSSICRAPAPGPLDQSCRCIFEIPTTI